MYSASPAPSQRPSMTPTHGGRPTYTPSAARRGGASVSPRRAGSRGSSLERAANADAAHDPVLQRYLQIKRDMEGNTSSMSAVSQQAPPAPQQQQQQQVAAPMAAQPQVNLYTSTLTPDPTQIQSKYSSPQRPAPRGGPPRVVNPQQPLQAPVHQDPIAATTQLAGPNATSVKSLVEATQEAHALRQQKIELESELDGAKRALEMKDRETQNVVHELQLVTNGRATVERELAQLKEDNTSLRQNVSTLQQSLTEVSNNNMSGKVLEGKVVALNDVIENQRRELDQVRGQGAELQRRLDEEHRLQDGLHAAIREREVRVGEATAVGEERSHEMARLRKRLEEASVTERQLQGRMMEYEEKIRSHIDDIDRQSTRHRDELREKNRQINELEMNVVSTKEQVREGETMRQRLHVESADAREERDRLEHQVRDLKGEVEKSKVLSAQAAIVNDEMTFELERHKKLINEMKLEIQQQEESERKAEAIIDELEQDRRVRLALEDQVRRLQDTIAKMDDDILLLRDQNDASLRRLNSTETELKDMKALQDTHAELKTQYEGRQLTLEKMYDREKALNDEIAGLHDSIRTLRGDTDEARRQVVLMHDELAEARTALEASEAKANKIPELEGKLGAMTNVAEDRQEQLRKQGVVLEEWKRKSEELDGDVETLLGIRQQFDVLSQERAGFLAQLEEKDEQIRALERTLSATEQAVQLRTDEAADCREIIKSLESQISRLNNQVMDRGQLESSLREATSDLAMKHEELLRERERRDDFAAKASSREDALTAERQHVRDLETQLTNQQQELSKLQVDVGRFSVSHEANERDINRLQRDLDAKTELSDKLQSNLSEAKHTLALQEGEMAQSRVRTKQLEDRVASLEGELDATNEQLSRQRTTAETVQAALRSAEDKIRASDASAGAARDVRDRLEQMTSDTRRTEGELKEATGLINELRRHNRELQREADEARTAKNKTEEQRSTFEKQMQLMENLERDDQSRQQLLLDKEREMGRLREQLTVLNADMDAERGRRRQFESRVQELEQECQRASALDGQVAGLNLVISQRTKELESEREAANELRGRVRALERSTSARSVSVSASGDTEAKLAIKNEIIAQLEAEEKRRAAMIDQLKRELERSESERRSAVATAEEARRRQESSDAQWVAKFNKLNAEVDDHRSREVHDSRLRDHHLASTKARISRMEEDSIMSASKVQSEAAEARRRSASMQRELEDAKSELVDSQRRRKAAEALLQDREVQLAVAQQRMAIPAQQPQQQHHTPLPSALDRSVGMTHSSPISTVGRGASPAPVTPLPADASTLSANRDIALTADEEIRRWRERRAQREAAAAKSPGVSATPQ